MTGDSNLFGHGGDGGVVGVAPPLYTVASGALNTILDPVLAFSGGPTQTHALVSGSEAVDQLDATACPATDQRGFLRPTSGTTCDIGAVEQESTLPSAVNDLVTFVAQPDTFSTTTPGPAACPPGTVGAFSFQAQLTVPGSESLEALKAAVVELTQGNTLLLADGGPAGAPAQYTLAEAGPLSDGTLEAVDGPLDVPFVICLQNLTRFRFLVDVLGRVLP